MAQLSQTALFSDSSLKGYWPMNGDFTDSSSSGYNLTAVNSPTFVTGKYGQAGHFVAASSQYANIASASCPNLEISGSQTWTCWIKPNSLANYEVPMGKGGPNVAQRNLQFGDNSQGLFFTQTGLSTTPQIAYNPYTFSTSDFTHIAGVYDSSASKVRLYINGSKVNEATASGSTSSAGYKFSIGQAGEWGAFYMDGAIDDAAIFNRALTDSEILLLFNPAIVGGLTLMGVGS